MNYSLIEEIKKRIDIVDFISSFIVLKKAGRNFKALCPFHQEKTPSFIVSPERQIWRCFGACDEGGDVIKFMMKWENLTFYEALKELAQRAGVPFVHSLSFEDKIWKKKQRFLQMNNLAAEFFSFVLLKQKYGERALNYLRQRGLTTDIITQFNLGYAPNSWTSLLDFLKRKNFTEEEILDNGLAKKTDKGNLIDFFRGRLIFSIKDARGLIVGFSGRVLDQTSSESKYINSPETLLFRKGEILYGIDQAKETIKKENNVYLVEGEFDVILPFQYGLKNFVAVKGTSLTFQQLIFLKRYTDRLTLMFDVDKAGIKSTKRAIDQAEKLDFEIRVVKLPINKDPDEAIIENFSLFKTYIKQSSNIYDFIIDTAHREYPELTPVNKKKLAEKVLPFIEKIANPIIKDHYLKKITKILEVSESVIRKMIKMIENKRQQRYLVNLNYKKINPDERKILIEKFLLSCLFQDEEPFVLAKKIFSILSPADFSQPAFQKIIFHFLEYQNKGGTYSLETFVDHLPAELKSVFDEVYLFSSLETPFSFRSLEKISLEIKKNSLKKEIREILEANQETENERLRLVQLNQQLKEVEKSLQQ
ncbi:MAG: DNA primase [Patescibacteria group bacterium]|nr:DNA primase [Patescibacteria group bacterium]